MGMEGFMAKKRTSVKGDSMAMGKSGKANPKKMKEKGPKKILDASVEGSTLNVGKVGGIKG